jgi:hypothetical protein
MHISAEIDNKSSQANSGTKFRRFFMQYLALVNGSNWRMWLF